MKQTFAMIYLLGLFLSAPEDELKSARQEMIRQIKNDMKATGAMVGKSRFSDDVLEAMETTERHFFVPGSLWAHAYENRPLPIGYGQTISQPYVVALMTELLAPLKTHRVLEIGTGSGYQAAVLSGLVDEVYTIEIVPELAKLAKKRLKKLGYDNVNSTTGDGYHGWEIEAPFDGIIVTAAADHIPPPLIEQLKPGGRMIIPVGGQFLAQSLTLVTKDHEGKVSTRHILPVRFVPFTRGN